MAYSIPAYNAVNFDDAGSTYTAPAYNAVNFDDGTAIGGAFSFAGVGTFTPASSAAARGVATFHGTGSFAPSGREFANASVAFGGVGSFAPVGRSLKTAAATWAGTGSFAAVGSAATRAAATFTGAGTFAGTSAAAAVAVAAFAGSGVLSAVAAALARAALVLAGSGAFRPAAPRIVFVVKFTNRGRLLLYEPLPLRTTRMLGNFADDAVLAQRYGDLTSGRFELLRLDDSTWFSADHPMTMADVFVDDQKTPGWKQETRTDSEGHTWTVVVLSAPAPNGAKLSATGTGKRNPRTGALIENPADIIEDVLRIAGITGYRWWDQLRAEAAVEGLRLAGSVGNWSVDSPKSIRAVIDDICQSAAAIWAPNMARLYPVTSRSGYVAKLSKMKVSNIVVSAGIDNTADVLRLSYDPDTAGARAQHYIELTANPALYGRIISERSFDWLRTPQNAETVGKRVLPWLAGERYDVAFDCGDDTVRPGQWVQFVDHPEWPFAGEDPEIMVLSAVANQGGKTIACTGQTLRTTPDAIVTAHSVAVPVTRDAALEVAVANGVTTIVARDPSGRLVPGARVNVDGGPAKTTDATGRVTFETKPGSHKVAIELPGKRTQILNILT